MWPLQDWQQGHVHQGQHPGHLGSYGEAGVAVSGREQGPALSLLVQGDADMQAVLW